MSFILGHAVRKLAGKVSQAHPKSGRFQKVSLACFFSLQTSSRGLRHFQILKGQGRAGKSRHSLSFKEPVSQDFEIHPQIPSFMKAVVKHFIVLLAFAVTVSAALSAPVVNKVLPNDPAAQDYFGDAVALDGST